ncbi:MAG TPA: GntR family transcriptional regulator, partial [Burkholderiaceae bacterium]
MHTDLSPRRPRTLALELVDSLGGRIRAGTLAAGDKLPTEAAVMEEFGVSRTVVR